jgi:phosphatidylethanolamine/phosphatidyl-N-methylethanolamine N-methyltransferase
MPLQTLQLLEKKIEQKFVRHIRLFEIKKGALERKIDGHIRQFELKRDDLERKIEREFETRKKKIGLSFESQKRKFKTHIRRFEEKNGIRLDDEVRFLRSWIEKPLSMGAVTPSGKALARTMAGFVDPEVPGPIIELGPGTGPVTEALVARGVDPSRLVLVEFDPTFCRLLRGRYPTATVIQGDAYGLRRLLSTLLTTPAAAVVSGLPLFTKPMRTRLRLLHEAFALMMPGAPFVQFTYAAYSPIPKALERVKAEASERIWTNIPPARVWIYRKFR